MKKIHFKRFIFSRCFLVSFILLLAAIGVYFWQHEKVNNLNKQVSWLKIQVKNLNNSNANLKQQNSNISDQLNKANQTVTSLSQNNSFNAGAPCQTQQLALVQENDKNHNPGGAAGTIGQLFSYQNVSHTTCTVQGYPGFLALDNKGYVVPNGPVEIGPSYKSVTVFNDPGSKLITLSPSAKSYFVVSWSDVIPAPGQVCIKPSLLESTPPSNSYPLVLVVSWSGDICGYGLSVSALGNLNDF